MSDVGEAVLGDIEATQSKRRRVRMRGTVLRVSFGVAAASTLALFGQLTMAAAVATLTLVVFLLNVLAPLRGRALLQRIERAIGKALAFLILAPAFFLFVTPLGLLRRRPSRRQNPIERAPDRNVKSYWIERERPSRLDRPY